MTSETMNDLVPLNDDGDDDAKQSGFRHVLRGYDPKQVEDYLDRVEVALNEADERHTEDSRRVDALEQQVGELTGRLGEAERRSSNQPETASALGERLTAMLRLAEQEASALRDSARQEADALVKGAKEKAAGEQAERTKLLDKRERDVATAERASESARLEAQKDAETVRTRAARETERELAQAKARADAQRADAERAAAAQVQTARDDVTLLHEQARREAAAMTAEARRQVDELGRQRDGLLAQLQKLQETLAAAMSPLSQRGAPVAESSRPGSARIDPQD